MSFQIEKGIPVPDNARGREKYPLRELTVGDSFYVKLTGKQAKGLRQSMSARAKKLSIKIVSMSDETGVRIWRVS